VAASSSDVVRSRFFMAFVRDPGSEACRPRFVREIRLESLSP
jgi:hypothetical protein